MKIFTSLVIFALGGETRLILIWIQFIWINISDKPFLNAAIVIRNSTENIYLRFISNHITKKLKENTLVKRVATKRILVTISQNIRKDTVIIDLILIFGSFSPWLKDLKSSYPNYCQMYLSK